MLKTALSLGTIFAGLGIVLGAFGAHALKQIVPVEQLQIFETGVRYQMYHAFGLIVAGLLYAHRSTKLFKVATTFFVLGILLFSGSLYAMTFLKIQGQVGLGGLGILTPLGGVFFIVGWLMLLVGILKK